MNNQNLLLQEQRVIGCVLLDETTLYLIREILSPDDFSNALSRVIFSEMCSLNDNCSPVNSATLLGKLIYNDVFNRNNGVEFLTNAPLICSSASLAYEYSRQVKESSTRSKLSTFADGLKKVTDGPIDDINSLISTLSEELYSLSDDGFTTPWRTFKNAMSDTCKAILEKNDEEVIKTGYSDLDAKLTGLRPGALTIIAARPAMGKTALGLNLMINAALHQNYPVAFFSLEMTTEELMNRVFSCIATINGNSLRQKHLTDEEWNRLVNVAELYSKANVFIDETPAIDISTLRDRARRMHKQYGIKLLIVDYLQLIKSDKKRIQSREQEVADISRTLKGIAKELHIPVISLSQLNRQLDGRADKRPIMSDLRESGSIEQDADNIIFIHREDYYHPGDQPTNEAEIIIAKQRSGPTGVVKLHWEGEYTRFTSIDNNF